MEKMKEILKVLMEEHGFQMGHNGLGTDIVSGNPVEEFILFHEKGLIVYANSGEGKVILFGQYPTCNESGEINTFLPDKTQEHEEYYNLISYYHFKGARHTANGVSDFYIRLELGTLPHLSLVVNPLFEFNKEWTRGKFLYEMVSEEKRKYLLEPSTPASYKRFFGEQIALMMHWCVPKVREIVFGRTREIRPQEVEEWVFEKR